MTDLTGRNALVTGAARGIGRAVAERLAAAGACVTVHYRTSEEDARATLAAIERAGGRGSLVRADLGTDEGLDDLFAGLGTGRLDIVVNNASMMSRGRDRIEPGEFDRLFAVNVRAPFFVVQRALPLMPDGGRVVNISSGATRIALRDFAYAMSKGATEVMGRVLANVLGERGITVNTVAPGLTASAMTGWLADPEAASAVGRVTALGRIGRPADIAGVVAFLASDEARWITGQVIDVSGGLWLGPRGEGNPWLSLRRGTAGPG
ncbi:SDR family oxidoreductase [Actinomadura viridis]|uniref:NAD(P)-dependent dehydrogenase (Short-subunit alcohol dehydrogenase family) n=1 Tax=Actinomadura viridis TaxID=58110 RepID=A0A931DPI3_9ACTN|nr:SDR family oxidoreductase [Actinomadura viridis]MBG6090383.1 NAD(P)-dependent dehydrogenase (short-subunit alcohol dehydrogenase family) [Actinomadura viridis]